MKEKIVELPTEQKHKVDREINGLKFTKNFRSATVEEWYVFLPSFWDPQTKGAAGTVIIHYDLFGNKDIFINTTIIYDDPTLYEEANAAIVYAVSEEIINRLVGYANTLVSVHCGSNSYQAEYTG